MLWNLLRHRRASSWETVGIALTDCMAGSGARSCSYGRFYVMFTRCGQTRFHKTKGTIRLIFEKLAGSTWTRRDRVNGVRSMACNKCTCQNARKGAWQGMQKVHGERGGGCSRPHCKESKGARERARPGALNGQQPVAVWAWAAGKYSQRCILHDPRPAVLHINRVNRILRHVHW